MNVIWARAIVQTFGGRTVLDGLDLSVGRGERVAVLGANGAGKTTLLRLLSTLDRPEEGELRFFEAEPQSSRRALRARIGYVGHQPGLYPALSARENLAFFCAAYGTPAGRADQLLEAVGLSSHGRELAGQFSRGMLQRLAIARSLLHDPELWVLDEPDSSLDDAGRRLLLDLAGSRTVVLSTHDAAFAAAMAENRLILVEGRLAPAQRRLEVVS